MVHYIPSSEGPGTVHLNGSLEQEGPDQPVGSEQGELVVGSRGKLIVGIIVITGGGRKRK